MSETKPLVVFIELLITAVCLTLAAGIVHRASSHHHDDGDGPHQAISQEAP